MSSEAAEAVAAMIASRAQERAAAFARKQTADATMGAFKTGQKTRRTFGLKRRHAARLARLRAQAR